MLKTKSLGEQIYKHIKPFFFITFFKLMTIYFCLFNNPKKNCEISICCDMFRLISYQFIGLINLSKSVTKTDSFAIKTYSFIVIHHINFYSVSFFFSKKNLMYCDFFYYAIFLVEIFYIAKSYTRLRSEIFFLKFKRDLNLVNMNCKCKIIN